MSLTHKALSAMGIEPEKIEQILEMHRETIDSIKADKDKAIEESKQYKENAEKVADLEKQITKLKEKSEKYDTLKKEYDDYKSDVTARETKAEKSKAYREMLKEIGISEKRLDTVLKVADIDSIELEDGKIKGVAELKAKAKEEWSDFIVSEAKAGAQTPTPPANTGGSTRTKKEIMAIKDYDERQKAIADNHELFGF